MQVVLYNGQKTVVVGSFMLCCQYQCSCGITRLQNDPLCVRWILNLAYSVIGMHHRHSAWA